MIYNGQPFASPTDALSHFGKKGMKWGVRNQKDSKPPLRPLITEKVVRKTANGDTFTLTPQPPNKFNKALARVSSNYRKGYENGSWLTVTDSGGKKIGSANFWRKIPMIFI